MFSSNSSRAAVSALCFMALSAIAAGPGAVLSHASPSPVSAPAATSVTPNAQEIELVNRINADRKAHGVGLLKIEPILIAAARAHSQEMCEKNYFDHHSPTPGFGTPVERVTFYLTSCGRQMPEFAIIGENIYYSSVLNDTYSVEYAHQQLMASPHHRKNILDPRYTRVGVGTYQDSLGEFWVTEEFMRDVPAHVDLADSDSGN